MDVRVRRASEGKAWRSGERIDGDTGEAGSFVFLWLGLGDREAVVRALIQPLLHRRHQGP